mgnify:CR=1 FL=1
MTPQLQQAIRLLQLSALQLKTEVQEALDSNLMLEVDEEGDSADDTPEAKPEETTPEDSRELGEPADNIPDELPVDTDWTDIYEPPTALAAPCLLYTSDAADDASSV